MTGTSPSSTTSEVIRLVEIVLAGLIDYAVVAVLNGKNIVDLYCESD